MKRKLETLAKSLYFDPPGEKETILLASSARSGSTWVQNVISSTAPHRVFFEPFHPKQVKEFSVFQRFEHIGRFEMKPDRFEAVESLIAGKISNDWIDQDNDLRLFRPKKRLIKAIRANLFLAWMKENFPALKLVFLLRHPFRVAKSQLQCGWPISPREILPDSGLIGAHFSNEDVAFFETMETPFGQQVAAWAILNLVPLRELDSSTAFLIAYEDILSDPAQELERLTGFLGEPSSSAQQLAINKKSRTSDFSKAEKVEVSERAREEALQVVARFGLDRIYGEDETTPPRFAGCDVFDKFPLTEPRGSVRGVAAATESASPEKD